MDEADGDPDLEESDEDESGSEDDSSQIVHDGPGCPISDCDMGADDEPHDGEADTAPAFDYGEDQTVVPLWQMNP